MNRAYIGALLWLVGCGGDVEPASQPLAQEEAEEPAAGFVVLDVGPAGRLLGIPHEAPPNADPDRVVTLRVEPASLAPELDGLAVLDARFVGDGLVLIDTEHALLHRGALGSAGEMVTLDVSVHGPIAVRDTTVAYTVGEAPFLEVARADVETGLREQLTHDLAPTWNPALGPDGEVYVVSGATGGPRLLRLGEGEPTVIPTERFPASVRAPVVEDGQLIFEDESGERVRLAVPSRGGAR